MTKLLSPAQIVALILLAVCSCATLATAAAPAAPPALDSAPRPWEHWKLDEQGYPPDRRLLKAVDVQQAKITIENLLADLQRQTGVNLRAGEPELGSQLVTLYAKALPLNALMVQLKELLGLYWYDESESEVPAYFLTYGSGPPEARAAAQTQEELAKERQRRADRIADILRASELSDDELKKLAETDPLLAEQLRGRKRVQSQLIVETLRGMEPANLRGLIDTGLATASGSELSPWFEKKLRPNYAESQETLAKIGIFSADDYVARWRVRLFDRGDWHNAVLDELRPVIGTVWGGINWVVGIETAPGYEAPKSSLTRPQTAGLTPVAVQVDVGRYMSHGSFPGKVDNPEAFLRLYYSTPRLDLSMEEKTAAAAAEAQAFEEQLLHTNPCPGDSPLSRLPDFPLKQVQTVAQALGAISDQTGYKVLGTYFDGHDASLPTTVSGEEPLFLLMNRMAKQSKCSWKLVGTIILWRHKDWFLLETDRIHSQRDSTRGKQS